MRLLTLARPLMLTLFIFFLSAIAINAQTTAFTYQGKLTDNTSVGNGTYDLQFALYDALTGGNQVGTAQTHTGVMLNRGIFTVDLDFGSQFPGADRWLEISVKKPSDSSYTTLNPRQKINSVPYAARALSAATADSLSSACVGCVADSQINAVSGSKVTGTVANATNAATAATAATATNATNAATASSVSSSAGDSVVTAINAGSSAVNTSKVSGDVELAPSAQQTTSSTNHLINLKLVSTDPVNHKLGAPGANALISLSASGTYRDNSAHDKERFRVDNDGSILSVADYTGGINTTAPIEGSGTRFMWYATKAAIRAGEINGTQWDDANIGLYSTAFGQNVRALGDNSIAVGKNSVAANTGTVALGEGHTATGVNSVALGYFASTSTSSGAPRTGSFVFSDRSVTDGTQFHAEVTNAAHWRVANGFRIYTSSNRSTGVTFQNGSAVSNWGQADALISTSTGAFLSTSGIGTNASSRDLKDNFAPVDSRSILRKVLSLPIQTWNYKSDGANIRHIGAIAQDFKQTFNFGNTDKAIGTVDADGVALAAIQGLNEELKDELKTRDAKIERLETQLKQHQSVLEGMKKLLCANNPNADVCK